MVGSSDAEAAVVEAADQRKQTGRKRVRTQAEKDVHNARCRKSRKKKKTRFEELEKWQTKVMPQLQALKMEQKESHSKVERMENEMRALKEQVANYEEMIRQIFTSCEIGGQKFRSFEHFQDWILSQNYEQQVCQGSDHSNITASQTCPIIAANPDFTTPLDVPNNPFSSHDLAASNITGFHIHHRTLTNPGTGFSLGANHGLPVNHDNNVLLTQNPTAGTLNNAGAGTSSGANHDLPVFDAYDTDLFAYDTGLFTYDPADGN